MKLGKYVTRSVVPILLLGGAITSNSAYGSLIFEGTATGKGAGIGASNIVLTIQGNPSEQGCVAWNGTTDVHGSAACPGGLSPAITGGNEKTGGSQTLTRTVGGTGVLTGSSLVVVMNLNVPTSGINVNNVSLSIYSPTGSVLFNSGNMTGIPVTISNPQGGQGTLGFALQLDSTEAAIANPFICTSGAGCSAANANNRFGLAASLSNTVPGRNDDFSIADTVNVAIAAPEPLTLTTLAGGLFVLGLSRRFRRTRRKN
jgi:hypothetical protein